MRHPASILKWALAGCAFTASVAIAVGTAVIKAGNVQKRREMQQVLHEIDALEATFDFEAMAWREVARPELLADRWERLESAWSAQRDSGRE